MKRLFSMILVLAVLACLILPAISLEASASPIEYFDEIKDFSGLQFSLIGDSISTFDGVSNNSTYNPLYSSSALFGPYYGDTDRSDYSQFADVTRAETWWQQTVDTLGMNLLVNNAWSASHILKDSGRSNTNDAYPAAGYKNRAVNLHIGSKKPDIIAVYLGTNDIGNYSAGNLGSKADVDTDSERNALYTSVNNYKTPTTSVQAYYIMINRMMATYPNAEIYLMTPTIPQTDNTGRINALNTFNTAVRYLADYWEGQGKKVFLCDLDKEVGLTTNTNVRNYYYANNLHPNSKGMDWITSCLISEILEHSTKGTGNSTFHKVSYSLSNTFAKAGLPRQVAEGQSLEVDMLPYVSGQGVELSVTMKDANGNNVQIPGGGVRGQSVYIPAVTGSVTVTAKAVSKDNFHWSAITEAFSATTGPGFDYNKNTLVAGSYTGSESSGAFTDAHYSLDRTVTLKYTQPWVVEFKGSGTFAGGILLTSTNENSTTDGNLYIHINQTNVLFGYRKNDVYNNSGISWADIASKMGSSAGANYRTETHVYKFVNVPNGTSNKIHLYVDGVEIGTMDSTKLIGASTTHADAPSVNISGKDFTFNYLGTTNFPLRNCSFSYIKIWENGVPEIKTENYRWEVNSTGNAFTPVEDGFFANNDPVMMAGSISGGTFTNTYFELEKQIILLHDEKWNLEWVSSGGWNDLRNGSMLLSGTNGSNDLNSFYLYRRSESTFIALGERKNGTHNNYGVGLAAHGIDGTARHKYNLINEVTTDAAGKYVSNMVYLYVDDVKIAPMTTYYNGGSSTGTTSDWVNGKDFAFSFIGNQTFTVGDCKLEYLQVSVACEHVYQAVVTEPTCTTEGYTTYTCSACGDSYTDNTVAAIGHNWTEADCDSAKTCTVCGATEGEALGHVWADADCDTAKTCTVCGQTTGNALGHNYVPHDTQPTCTTDGYTTFTCTICGDSYLDGVIIAQGHTWSDATCTTAKMCSVCGATKGEALGHSWNGYSCFECGQVRDFYLFGYINGSDYACEGDYTNMGIYKFVDGKLVATFTQDSYIGVKTTGNGAWYMTQSYVTENSATFYNTNTGTSEKMFVPGGVEVSFYLTVNENDSVTISYELAQDEVVVPVINLNYPTLSFEDEILYNVYYTLDDATSIVEMGLITFATRDANGSIDTAWEIIPGYANSGNTYMVQSNGVPAKNLSDAVYFKVYAKLTDGSYVYSDIAGYHAVAYANTVLNSNAATKAKALVVAMLNYGAAAQEYFGYKTDALMNANLTAEQQALVSVYDDSMVMDVVKADASKVGSFKMNGGYSNIYPTVSFEGAFSINYYFTLNQVADAAPIMYYWDAKTYASVDVLTPENATGVLTMKQDGSTYGAAVEGIAAKAIDETIYVAGFYTSDGVSYPTGVISYSLGNYCKTIANNGEAFGAATAVYGFYAKSYFA